MDFHALRAELAGYEADPALADETNFAGRARALDFVGLLREVARRGDEADRRLAERGRLLGDRLDDINRAVVTRFHARLRDGSLRGPDLRAELDRFTNYRPGMDAVHLGYDSLDHLLDGVFTAESVPDASDTLPHEMVHYEASPARVLLDLIDRVRPGPSDLFYDLGSGDGRIAVLAALVAGVDAVGVEIQPDLCAYAARRSGDLGASNVAFRNADARDVDYDDASILYLFTPFRGHILDTVLERVRATARAPDLTVCTFGPCTFQVQRRHWLQPAEPGMLHDFRLAIWRPIDWPSRVASRSMKGDEESDPHGRPKRDESDQPTR